jgi:hypothetical protein
LWTPPSVLCGQVSPSPHPRDRPGRLSSSKCEVAHIGAGGHAVASSCPSFRRARSRSRLVIPVFRVHIAKREIGATTSSLADVAVARTEGRIRFGPRDEAASKVDPTAVGCRHSALASTETCDSAGWPGDAPAAAASCPHDHHALGCPKPLLTRARRRGTGRRPSETMTVFCSSLDGGSRPTARLHWNMRYRSRSPPEQAKGGAWAGSCARSLEDDRRRGSKHQGCNLAYPVFTHTPKM